VIEAAAAAPLEHRIGHPNKFVMTYHVLACFLRIPQLVALQSSEEKKLTGGGGERSYKKSRSNGQIFRARGY
jgi:hypothetical protein